MLIICSAKSLALKSLVEIVIRSSPKHLIAGTPCDVQNSSGERDPLPGCFLFQGCLLVTQKPTCWWQCWSTGMLKQRCGPSSVFLGGSLAWHFLTVIESRFLKPKCFVKLANVLNASDIRKHSQIPFEIPPTPSVQTCSSSNQGASLKHDDCSSWSIENRWICSCRMYTYIVQIMYRRAHVYILYII